MFCLSFFSRCLLQIFCQAAKTSSKPEDDAPSAAAEEVQKGENVAVRHESEEGLLRFGKVICR